MEVSCFPLSLKLWSNYDDKVNSWVTLSHINSASSCPICESTAISIFQHHFERIRKTPGGKFLQGLIIQDHGWLLLSMSLLAFLFSDFRGLIEFWSSSIQWFSGSTFHLASVAVGGRQEGAFLFGPKEQISVKQVFLAQHTSGPRRWMGGWEHCSPRHMHTLTPTLSLTLPFSSLWFPDIISLAFLLHNSQENPRTLCFSAFFKKKVVSWQKKSVKIFSPTYHFTPGYWHLLGKSNSYFRSNLCLILRWVLPLPSTPLIVIPFTSDSKLRSLYSQGGISEVYVSFPASLGFWNISPGKFRPLVEDHCT